MWFYILGREIIVVTSFWDWYIYSYYDGSGRLIHIGNLLIVIGGKNVCR